MVFGMVTSSVGQDTAEWWGEHNQGVANKDGHESWFTPLSRGLIDGFFLRTKWNQQCPRPGTALVLGAGFSTTALTLARSGLFSRVVGLDSAGAAVRHMTMLRSLAIERDEAHRKSKRRRRRSPWSRLDYMEADALDSGLRNSSFSVVLDEGLLDLLQGIDPTSSAAQSRLRQALGEQARLVAPGGVLAVVGFGGSPRIFSIDPEDGTLAAPLADLTLSCWTRAKPQCGEKGLLRPWKQLLESDVDPRLACSPFGAGGAFIFESKFSNGRNQSQGNYRN